MAITSTTQSRTGNTTIVTVTSDLTSPRFYWYVDGAYVGSTAGGTRSFVMAQGEQSQIDVLDSTDPAFDPVASAPEVFPSRRTLVWVRSLAADVARYRVEQFTTNTDWATVGYIAHDPGRWQYSFLTGQLDDLTAYQWRVIPIDTAGNDGTAISLGGETIVRRPTAPNFTAAFDAGTTKVTFTGAT